MERGSSGLSGTTAADAPSGDDRLLAVGGGRCGFVIAPGAVGFAPGPWPGMITPLFDDLALELCGCLVVRIRGAGHRRIPLRLVIRRTVLSFGPLLALTLLFGGALSMLIDYSLIVFRVLQAVFCHHQITG